MALKPYTTLSDHNFRREVLEHVSPVLVVFTADWCGAWHIMAPSVEALAQTFANEAKVGLLNVDTHPQTARRYGVHTLPTLLFFKNHVVVEQLLGITPKGTLATTFYGVIYGDAQVAKALECDTDK